MIEQRRPYFQTDRHAGAIDLHQDVVGQISQEIKHLRALHRLPIEIDQGPFPPGGRLFLRVAQDRLRRDSLLHQAAIEFLDRLGPVGGAEPVQPAVGARTKNRREELINR